MRTSETGAIETDYLVYKGSKDSGTITILGVRASSPYRYFHFMKGGRYEIGRQVTQQVADWLVKYHRPDYGIVTEETAGEGAFIVAMANLLSLYKPVLKMDDYEEFVPLIQKAFEHEGSKVKIRKVVKRKAKSSNAKKKLVPKKD